MPDRKILILLTRFPDMGAKIISLLSKSKYTHASIGFEDDRNTFYSFVTKGFIVEKVTRYIRPDRTPFPCQLYELPVSEQVYNRIRDRICFYENSKRYLHYSKAAVTLCLFRIPFQRRFRYFCSYFVAEILNQSGAVRLKKHSALYLPADFSRMHELERVFEGNMMTLAQHYAL